MYSKTKNNIKLMGNGRNLIYKIQRRNYTALYVGEIQPKKLKIEQEDSVK